MAGLLDWWRGTEGQGVSPLDGQPMYIPPEVRTASTDYVGPLRNAADMRGMLHRELDDPSMGGKIALGFGENVASVKLAKALPAARPLAAPTHGNVDYGAEVMRQREAQLAIPKQENRIQPDPADPAFDATPTAEMLPGVAQGQMAPMRRADPGAKLPQGDRFRPIVEHRAEIADRIASDIAPKLGHDTQYFYHMKPLYDALRSNGASHEQALAFVQKDFAPINAGTSPRTNTQQNLLNTSMLQYRRAQGLPIDEAHYEAQGNVPGYGMIKGTHPRMVSGLLDGTHDIGANPKPYYFGGNIAGDLAYTTADTHAINSVVGTLNDIRPGMLNKGLLAPDAAFAPQPAKGGKAATPGSPTATERYAADPTKLNWATDIDNSLAAQTTKGAKWQPEYPLVHDVYDDVGKKLGIPTADAQSLTWFANGGRTGLMSAARSIPQLINERLSITAQALGISPQKAMALYQAGKIPLMSAGGAAVVAPGLLDQPAGEQ